MKRTMTRKAILAMVGVCLSFTLSFGAAADGAKQKYSTASTISDLLANPKAKAVVDKYIPELSKSDQLSMVESMSLDDLSAIPQAELGEDKLKAIQNELSQIK